MYFTCQLLTTQTGDITLGWTEDQAAMMIEVLQKKMDEGYTFFIQDETGRDVRLRQIGDLKSRSITIGDREAELLIRQGRIGIVDVSTMVIDSDDNQKTAKPSGRRAKTAHEAATAHTVATRKMGGG